MGALALLAGFISVPLVALFIWTVAEDSWRAMLSPVAVDALLLSLRTTLTSLAILILVGTPAAYVLSRREFPGRRIVDSLVDLPIVLPPSAAGIALLLVLGSEGFIGRYLGVLGIEQVTFTTAAVVLAELFVASPFYVRAAVVAFSSAERDVEEAARVDGAGSTGVFTRITVPLALPALVSGAITAWARALGEFGATIIFAGNFRGTTQTLPLAIYATLQSNFDAAVAISALVVGFAFVVILTTRYLTRRSIEYQGRSR